MAELLGREGPSALMAEDLFGVQVWLGGLDLTDRVGGDEAFLAGRLQDAQQDRAAGHHPTVAELGFQFVLPAQHDRGRDLAQLAAAEVGAKVAAQVAFGGLHPLGCAPLGCAGGWPTRGATSGRPSRRTGCGRVSQQPAQRRPISSLPANRDRRHPADSLHIVTDPSLRPTSSAGHLPERTRARPRERCRARSALARLAPAARP